MVLDLDKSFLKPLGGRFVESRGRKDEAEFRKAASAFIKSDVKSVDPDIKIR